MEKIEYKRLPYMYQGRKIYEWEQSLEEVHCYIEPPPGVTAKMIDCKITSNRLTLGIKGNPPFIDVRVPLSTDPKSTPLIPAAIAFRRSWRQQ